MARVFIVVTVETQQLPVAAVGRIVVMVVVFVMDRELAKFSALEFSPAARTDPGKKLECFLPVTLLTLMLAAPGLRDNPLYLVPV